MSSAVTFPFWLDDVVFDILCSLSVKSLIRFRFVSKSWNSIITNPIFIKTHFDRAKSLLSNNNSNKNHNSFLLYLDRSSCKELCTAVWNSDPTLTEVSRFMIPFLTARIVEFSNGMFCFYNHQNHIIYLWNPRIRKFKMLAPTHLTHPFESISTRPLTSVAVGFGFHSQNNDFKILRIVCYNKEVEAEVYTLSMDTWRRVVISLESEPSIGSIDEIVASPRLFFNGALHSLAYSRNHKFILSFDVNDEIFHAIELPQNLDGAGQPYERLILFTGCLAFIVCNEDADADIWHIWGMIKYGAVKSWTKITELCVEGVMGERFFDCTNSGELLIEIFDGSLGSFDFENLNVKHLRIRSPPWLGYTTDLMESLVFLDQVKMSSKNED